jgi:hypothetical protein
MPTQNWNGGNRLTISQSNPLQCLNSIVNPINVAFLYNSTEAAQSVPIDLVGANQFFTMVTIPETTGNSGSAALLTFSGPGNGGSASLTATLDPTAGSGTQADAWLGSQAMPTNTALLNNASLPADGSSQPFNKYCRYYFVPAAEHYELNVQSGIDAFYFAVFNSGGQVTVYVLNAPSSTYEPIVQQFTGDTYAINNTTVTPMTAASVTIPIFGNNEQWVVMNADSTADSTNTSISLTAIG